MKEQLEPGFIRRNMDNIRVAAGTIALATVGAAAGLYIGNNLTDMFDAEPKPEPFEYGLEAACMAGEELFVQLDSADDSSVVFEATCVEPGALPIIQSRPLVVSPFVEAFDSRTPENPLVDQYTLEIAGRATPESYVAISDKDDEMSSDVQSLRLYVSSDEHLSIEGYRVVDQDGQEIQGIYMDSAFNGTPQSATVRGAGVENNE